MLALHAGVRVHLALGATDMRRGFDGLAAQVQTVLEADPFSGHLFLFRGKRGDLLKALWWDGQGLVLLAKRLEKGRFIWPTIARRRCDADDGAAGDAVGRPGLAHADAELEARGRGIGPCADAAISVTILR
jgi:transposase